MTCPPQRCDRIARKRDLTPMAAMQRVVCLAAVCEYPSRLGVGTYQRMQGEGFVQAAGVGQHPGETAGEAGLISSPLHVRPAQHGCGCALSEERDHCGCVAAN